MLDIWRGHSIDGISLLSEETVQIAVQRREVKSKGEKKRYTHLNEEFQRVTRTDKKAFFSDQCKEIEENNRMGRLEISSRKLEILREYFSCVVGRGCLL